MLYHDETLMGRIYLYTIGDRGYVFDAYRGLYRIGSYKITEVKNIAGIELKS